MNTNDLIRKLKNLAECFKDENIIEGIGIVAINRTLAGAKIRIFEDGRATNGTPIGKYSTKPIYVGRKEGLPAIKPAGKTGAKNRKTRYYAGGYKEYRADVGRQNTKVDLNLTSSMAGAYKGGFNSKGQAAIGFVSEDEAKKMDANEKRFRKIIAPPTDQERDFAIDAARLEIELLIKEKLL